jgi:hypothetical protein
MAERDPTRGGFPVKASLETSSPGGLARRQARAKPTSVGSAEARRESVIVEIAEELLTLKWQAWPR